MEYNDLIYDSGPVKFKDYVTNRYNIVHNKLYENALYRYIYEYTSDMILNRILYSLFTCMNNCITPYNDEDTIINIDNLFDGYRVYTTQEIESHNIINEDYIDILINYISSSKYKDNIYGSFNELNLSQPEQKDSIKYIVTNVIILLSSLTKKLQQVFTTTYNTNYDISNFIIRYDNTLYILSENENELNLYESELIDNEIFILEQQFMSDIHIGYTGGKFIINVDSNIDISSIYDTLYFIIETINKMIFDMCNSITIRFKDSHKIIEKKNTEFWMPSSILIFDKVYPHKKRFVDLTPYWSTYQDKTDITYEDLKIIDEPLNDSIIQHINYVKGNVDLYSKIHDIQYKADSKYINADTTIDDDLIKDTFINKLKNGN